MALRFALEAPSAPAATTLTPPPDEELDDVAAVMVACGHLEDAGYRFRAAGFGDANWWVDVGYDLSALLEELPGVLAAVRSGAAVELDLYPQGLERTLTFRPGGDPDTTEVRCRSRTGWTPDPAVETVPTGELEAMLVTLAQDAATALETISSPLARQSPFTHWRIGSV